MKFVRFFHRYEVNDGLLVQDQEAIIATGSYILLYYPKSGEFIQIDEKVDDYPGAVSILMNEYVARLGFFKGCSLILKNLLGISHCKIGSYITDVPVDSNQTFEDFFDGSESPDNDLRPPIIVGTNYDNEV